MNEMIAKRSSCRSYQPQLLSEEMLDKIRNFKMVALYPGIDVQWRIVSKKHVKSICPWTTQQMIAVYSEKKDGYLENAGFMFQQMDLYLQSLGLGVCWLGLGSPDEEVKGLVPGMEFVILLTVGYPKKDPFRKGAEEFKRDSLEKIADVRDERLEPVRLAPSSVNSQPWYFTHDGEKLHVYCSRRGLIRSKRMAYFNRIDMGIGLAHLYVANPGTFRFFLEKEPAPLKGYDYTGTIIL